MRAYFASFAFSKAALFAGIVAISFFWIAKNSPIFDTFEAWSSDWRTAFFSTKLEGQHPRVAVILINETTIAKLKYRSPIDRGFLAQLVQTIDGGGPDVIGLDLWFDQPTEPQKDKALIAALHNAKAKAVLVEHDDQDQSEAYQREYNKKILAETNRPGGSPAIMIDADGTVRRRADAPIGEATFAEAVVREAGGPPAPASKRISWLRPPDREEAIQTVFAHDLMPDSSPLSPERRLGLIKSLHGKIAIVGGDLRDRKDSFQTPLSKLSNDPMPGAVIHAQIAAQILDGRSYKTFSPEAALAFAAIAAFLGFSIGWRHHESSLATGLPPIVVFLIADVIAFTQFGVILPFGMPAAAWFAGVVLGQWTHWLEERHALKTRGAE